MYNTVLVTSQGVNQCSKHLFFKSPQMWNVSCRSLKCVIVRLWEDFLFSLEGGHILKTEFSYGEFESMIHLKKEAPNVPWVQSDDLVPSSICFAIYLPILFLSVLVLTVKGAGGKPCLSALVERVTFLECVWPEFTMGEYILKCYQ